MAGTLTMKASMTVVGVLIAVLAISSLVGCQARYVVGNEKFLSEEVAGNTVVTSDSKAVSPDVVKGVADLVSRLQKEWHSQVIDRNTVTCKIVDHFRSAFPDYNTMVVHSHHLESFHDKVHQRITVPTGRFSDTSFDIYVFKSGLFTLLGDGGEINWCFGGYFRRDGSKVDFSAPP